MPALQGYHIGLWPTNVIEQEPILLVDPPRVRKMSAVGGHEP